eukprot:6995674-Pyramimonas_sp.AAC.1
MASRTTRDTGTRSLLATFRTRRRTRGRIGGGKHCANASGIMGGTGFTTRRTCPPTPSKGWPTKHRGKH